MVSTFLALLIGFVLRVPLSNRQQEVTTTATVYNNRKGERGGQKKTLDIPIRRHLEDFTCFFQEGGSGMLLSLHF